MLSDISSHAAQDALPLDPAARAAAEASHRPPPAEWAVLGLDDAELFRCPTLEQAYRAVERLRPQLKDDAAQAMRVVKMMRRQNHAPGAESDAACGDAQDCSWLLRQLGYVTIFAFSRDESDAQFLVVGRGGQRVEQPTLTSALHALLRASDRTSRLPPIAPGSPSSWPDEDV